MSVFSREGLSEETIVASSIVADTTEPTLAVVSLQSQVLVISYLKTLSPSKSRSQPALNGPSPPEVLVLINFAGCASVTTATIFDYGGCCETHSTSPNPKVTKSVTKQGYGNTCFVVLHYFDREADICVCG